MLASAQRDITAKDYASVNNRAYYSIFHAMRAVLALDGEDYKKAFGRHCPVYTELFEGRNPQIDYECLTDSKPQ